MKYSGAMRACVFLLMSIAMTSSWNIIGGFAGYISLGHGVFYAIGGYVSALMLVHWGVSPYLSAPIAGLAAVAFGVASTPAGARDPDGVSRRAAYALIEGAIRGIQKRSAGAAR